jgi:transposase
MLMGGGGVVVKYEEWLTEDGLTKLAGWARNGLTDAMIAEKVGVNVSTLYEWKKRFEAVGAALKRGKEVVDLEVENSLLKRCHGYTVTLMKAVKVKRVEYDPTTGKKTAEVEEVVQAEDQVYVHADTAAEIFWLKNRKPAEWRDRREETKGDGAGSGETGVAILPEVELREDEGG